MSSVRVNNRRDLLLLLLYSPGASGNPNEPISGRTRLVKMLYLFKEELLPKFRRGIEIDIDSFYEFFPWSFGPFSVQVFDDLNFFILRGFVASSSSDEEPLAEAAEEWGEWAALSGVEEASEGIQEYEEEKYALTERGVTYAEGLFATLSEPQRKLLREFKERLARVPLRALLRYVYEKYPSMTERSTIRDNVLR